MRIKSFSFYDELNNMKFENINFSKINLLVGPSGVGKTKILESIRTIAYFLNPTYTYNPFILSGRNWKVNFIIDNREYIWECIFETDRNITENSIVGIKAEQLYKIAGNNKIIILSREDNNVWYNDISIKLNNKNSAISMLTDNIFSQIILEFNKILNIIYPLPQYPVEIVLDNIEEQIELEDIINKDMHIYLKGFFVQQYYPELFERIRHTYKSIFPFVEDIKLDAQRIQYNKYRMYFVIKEYKTNWTVFLSSGMEKTFITILNIYLSPKGTIFLIDEFENSLGVNCLDETAELLLDEDKDYQIIVTSHHPYIINKIGIENWLVVKRNSGYITAETAEQAGIDMQSSQDPFLKFINTIGNF